MTDRLLLLNPGWFDDQGGPWYCPPGAVIEGALPGIRSIPDHLNYFDPDIINCILILISY